MKKKIITIMILLLVVQVFSPIMSSAEKNAIQFDPSVSPNAILNLVEK